MPWLPLRSIYICGVLHIIRHIHAVITTEEYIHTWCSPHYQAYSCRDYHVRMLSCYKRCNRRNTSVYQSPSFIYIYVNLFFHSQLPCDAIWPHKTGPSLAQARLCCLTAQSHYMNWLFINEVLCHLPESDFTVTAQVTALYNGLEEYFFENTVTSPRCQWFYDSLYTLKYNTIALILLVFYLELKMNNI